MRLTPKMFRAHVRYTVRTRRSPMPTGGDGTDQHQLTSIYFNQSMMTRAVSTASVRLTCELGRSHSAS